jgi:tRNA nucleotidyltransferase/poly(A) polymerase
MEYIIAIEQLLQKLIRENGTITNNEVYYRQSERATICHTCKSKNKEMIEYVGQVNILLSTLKVEISQLKYANTLQQVSQLSTENSKNIEDLEKKWKTIEKSLGLSNYNTQ